MKRKLETVLSIFLRTCKTVSRKLFINSQDRSKISQFIYTFIVVTRTMKLLEFVTPPSIFVSTRILSPGESTRIQISTQSASICTMVTWVRCGGWLVSVLYHHYIRHHSSFLRVDLYKRRVSTAVITSTALRHRSLVVSVLTLRPRSRMRRCYQTGSLWRQTLAPMTHQVSSDIQQV